MGIIEIIVVSISLAMDAFAVAICKGLSMKKMNWKNAVIIALYFGVFQGLMPVVGYFLGTTFGSFIESVDHWIAFILLLLIGLSMIKDAVSSKERKEDNKVDVKTMVVLAIATSIDALAVGITFAFFEVNISLAALIVGAVTFMLSIIGVWIGNKFGGQFQNKAKLAGGIVLIIIGLKILLEHLGVVTFWI